jgi:hypothetical protein
LALILSLAKQAIMRLGRLAFYGILLLIAVLQISSACSPVECPANDATLLKTWFPYAQGDKKYFSSSLGQQDTLLITSFTNSEAYTSKGGQGCNHAATVTGTGSKNYNNQEPFFYLYDGADDGHGYAEIRVRGFHSSSGPVSDTGFRDPNCLLRSHSNYTLGSRQYTRVQELYLDTLVDKTSPVYRVYVAKGYGLVGYDTYPDRTTWRLQ